MKCDECEADIVEIKSEWCCSQCGVICGEIFEKDEYNKKGELIRHSDGNNVGLGSVIGYERMKGASKLRRLAVVHSLSKQDRRLKKALFFCNIVASEFRLSEPAKKDMKIYYGDLSKKHIFTSAMKLEERAAAIGYLVLREHGYSYTLLEVSKVLDISSKRISKFARLFARVLGKSYVFANVNVDSLLEKFSKQLNMDNSFIKDTINLHIYLNKIDSRHPTSAYLGAVIYFVETTKPSKTLTQNKISKILGIGIRTIRRNYSELLSLVGIESTFGLTIDDIIEGIR